MKFRHVNPRNVQQLCPPWALDYFSFSRVLDNIFEEFTNKYYKIDPDKELPFWIEVGYAGDSVVELKMPADDGVDNSGRVLIKAQSPLGGECQIDIPLNEMFKGIPDISGIYLLYCHSITTKVGLSYWGITKQRWFDRLCQHSSSANCGSSLLFHRAIREHRELTKIHKVVLAGIGYEHAMNFEEEMVSLGSLYPLGLNMIPGGFSGLAYLNKLGVLARSSEERDSALQEITSRTDIEGRPNPLCAARWEADQDFVNRIICGHSGRLTVDQVRTIRLLNDFGISTPIISERLGVADDKKVSRVISGRRYGRVA